MEKNLLKNFGKYVGLNILGMVGLSFYILADTYFIAKALGPTGLAALNLSISIYGVIHGIGLMVGIGGATRFSILKSRDRDEKAHLVFSTAVKSGLMIGLVMVLVGLSGAGYLASILGADNLTLPLTRTYLRTILTFAPFFILNNILLAFVRNDSNPNLSMIAMLTGSLANIVLDYVFMFPLGMGMFGAAFATALTPIISLSILAFHFIGKKDAFAFLRGRMRWKLFPDIFRLGSSAFIIEMSSSVALIIFNLVILGIEGNMGLAAYGIVANLALVALSVFTGLGHGIQPLASRYHGLKRDDLVRKVRQYALTTAVIIASMLYLLVLLYSGSIVHAFNGGNNPDIARIADKGLKIYFVGFFFAGINIVAAIVLSATEKARDAFSISMARGIVLMVPLVIVLSRFGGMTGVWSAFVFTEFLVAIRSGYLIRAGRKRAVHEQVV
jgi:putative MATE family efflux protein